jgi:AraC-like DNA-binding protein
MKTILILGQIQAAFFALLLITKKRKDTADYILAALFFFMLYYFFVAYVLISELLYRFPHLIGTAVPLTLLLGPLVYFYVKVHLDRLQVFKWRDGLHFLPYLVNMAYFIPFFLLPGEEKIGAFLNLVQGTPSAGLAIALMLYSCSPIVYALWCITVLTEHREDLKHLFSYTTEKMTVDWMWYLSWTMFAVAAIAFLINGIIVFSDIVDWIQLRYVIITVVVAWTFALGYYGVRRTSFFNTFPVDPENMQQTDHAQAVKYEKTKLKDEDARTYGNRLLHVMETEKPYLNSKLTIAQLANAVQIPAHHLSQLINDRYNANFFEFVNAYRVEEVKARFVDPGYKNLTLLGIALESGFNSKASFNRIFKQVTGMTPSEYIKSADRSTT